MLKFHLLSRIAYLKHVFMIDMVTKNGSEVYQKLKYTKVNKQTVWKNRQTKNCQVNKYCKNCS